MSRHSARLWGARGAALVILLGGATGCSHGEHGGHESDSAVVRRGVLTVCTSLPQEPFEFEKDGQTVGFDVDLATEVAKRLELKTAFVNGDFDSIQAGKPLDQGVCDVAVAAMTITGDRARVLDFSSPYFNAAQTLVVGSDSPATSFADLKRAKIAVEAGTTGELYVSDHAPASDIVTFKDQSAMADAVVSGEVAGAVYDNTVVGDVLAEHPELEVAAEFDTGEQYGMAVKKNGNIELLRMINDVLATLQDGGGYAKIYAKWFGVAPRREHDVTLVGDAHTTEHP